VRPFGEALEEDTEGVGGLEEDGREDGELGQGFEGD
jgi:hypothetical protein